MPFSPHAAIQHMPSPMDPPGESPPPRITEDQAPSELG